MNSIRTFTKAASIQKFLPLLKFRQTLEKSKTTTYASFSSENDHVIEGLVVIPKKVTHMGERNGGFMSMLQVEEFDL